MREFSDDFPVLEIFHYPSKTSLLCHGSSIPSEDILTKIHLTLYLWFDLLQSFWTTSHVIFIIKCTPLCNQIGKGLQIEKVQEETGCLDDDTKELQDVIIKKQEWTKNRRGGILLPEVSYIINFFKQCSLCRGMLCWHTLMFYPRTEKRWSGNFSKILHNYLLQYINKSLLFQTQSKDISPTYLNYSS